MIPGFTGEGEGAKGVQDGSGPDAAAGLLRRGQVAARKGDHVRAARLLRAALIADPTNEEARLWLAAVAEDPQESIRLLTKVLREHPENRRAAAGLRWAWDRLEAERKASIQPAPPLQKRVEATPARPRVGALGVAALVFCLIVAVAGAFVTANRSWVSGLGMPDLPISLLTSSTADPLPVANLSDPTATAEPTSPPTDEPPTPTPLPTATLLPTATALPTATPLPTATQTPTAAPSPTRRVAPTQVPIANTQPAGKWIEVNLSTQTLIAWEGRTAVRRMLVSTGLRRTPTVTGSYRIYVKLLSTPMSGPGYYLPNVPYTMYFYRGYALHGAYWHNNFGRPMSHGCVNLRVSDAAWLFNWASPVMPRGARVVYASADNPGTLVVIHY